MCLGQRTRLQIEAAEFGQIGFGGPLVPTNPPPILLLQEVGFLCERRDDG